MNFKRLIALLMVCAYLILPLDSFANLGTSIASPLQSSSSTLIQKSTSLQEVNSNQEGTSIQELAIQTSSTIQTSSIQTSSIQASSIQESSIQELVPLGADSHCPCSERHGSDGCNPSCSCCSCCSFFAPLPAGIAWRPLEPVVSFSMLEPFKRFPEVYLPIFVPPQNLG
jgi:hypothetical protein